MLQDQEANTVQIHSIDFNMCGLGLLMRDSAAGGAIALFSSAHQNSQPR